MVLVFEPPKAGGCTRSALVRQRCVSNDPPVVDTTDDVVFRATSVVEEDFVELSCPIGLHNWTHLNAGLAHGHQQVRDSFVFCRLGVGAGKQENIVSVLGTGGPHFLAVDDPLVAVEHCRGFQAGKVASRVWLRETLAPANLALENLRQKMLLLLFSAVLKDGWSHQRVAEKVGSQRCPVRCKLFSQHDVLHRGQTLATVFGGPGRTNPSTFEQSLGPTVVERLSLIDGHFKSVVHPPGREVGGQPFTDFDAECFGFGGVVQHHRHQPSLRPPKTGSKLRFGFVCTGTRGTGRNTRHEPRPCRGQMSCSPPEMRQQRERGTAHS